jgi:hypothetical protein
MKLDCRLWLLPGEARHDCGTSKAPAGAIRYKARVLNIMLRRVGRRAKSKEKRPWTRAGDDQLRPCSKPGVNDRKEAKAYDRSNLFASKQDQKNLGQLKS